MIGPSIPTPSSSNTLPEDDDYVPELPPDLIAAQHSAPKRAVGPTMPSMRPRDDDDDSDDDDVGPMPLPSAYSNSQHEEQDGVSEFLEREKRRKEAIEVCVLHVWWCWADQD
jgi:hypothetical protein